MIVASMGYQSSEEIIFVALPENAKVRSLRIGPFFLLLIMSMAYMGIIPCKLSGRRMRYERTADKK